MPFGSQAISDGIPSEIHSPGDEEAMEVDAVLVPEEPVLGQNSEKDALPAASQPTKEKSKTKKRKVEDPSPKKARLRSLGGPPFIQQKKARLRDSCFILRTSAHTLSSTPG